MLITALTPEEIKQEQADVDLQYLEAKIEQETLELQLLESKALNFEKFLTDFDERQPTRSVATMTTPRWLDGSAEDSSEPKAKIEVKVEGREPLPEAASAPQISATITAGGQSSIIDIWLNTPIARDDEEFCLKIEQGARDDEEFYSDSTAD